MLLAANSICYLKEQYLCYYRIRQSSMSHSMKKLFYADEILKLIDGMREQFLRYAKWQDMLHGQLCLYACYMFDNMLSACLDFKTLFFSKDFRRQIAVIGDSAAGRDVIAYCRKIRTSSRTKRVLRVVEKRGLFSKIELYLFWKYERIKSL